MIVPVYWTLVICLRAALNVLLFSLSSYCFLYIAWGFSKCGREGAKWILKSWRCLLKSSVWNHLTPRWRKQWCWFMGVLGFIKKLSCFLPMGFLLLYRILFLIFISELLKRKTRPLLGDMRITYAEITDMSQSACYLNLAWEDGREGSTRISLNFKCLMFYQWVQVSSLILDVNYMFWGVFTWWEIKALQIQALFFVHLSMRRKKKFVRGWGFAGGKWGRDEEGKGLQMHATELEGSVLPADAQPHLCTWAWPAGALAWWMQGEMRFGQGNFPQMGSHHTMNQNLSARS